MRQQTVIAMFAPPAQSLKCSTNATESPVANATQTPVVSVSQTSVVSVTDSLGLKCSEAPRAKCSEAPRAHAVVPVAACAGGCRMLSFHLCKSLIAIELAPCSWCVGCRGSPAPPRGCFCAGLPGACGCSNGSRCSCFTLHMSAVKLLLRCRIVPFFSV